MKKFPLQLIFQGVDQVTKPFRNIRNSISHFQNNLKSAGEAFQKSMDKTATIGLAQNAVENFRDKAVGAFTPIIEKGMNFEKTMSEVGALSRLDKTSKSFKDLEKTALKLGETTSYSASQAAEGMTFLAMAGFDATKIIQTMPNMLKLAKVGKLDLARAADIASNTLGAFKMEASDMGRVANVMSATITRSNVSMENLAETFKFVAPVANSAGMSIEDLASMTGLLGDIGIQGSMAGTALRAGILRFSKLPKPAAAALDDLGIATMQTSESIKRLTDQGFDTSKMKVGDLRRIPDILEDIRIKTKNMGSGQRLKLVAEIFGTEASAAFTELISKADASGKSINAFSNEISKAANNNEIEKLSKDMADNLQGVKDSLDSASEGVMLTVFNEINPALKSMGNALVSVIRSISEFAKENPNLTKTIVLLTAGIAGLSIVLASVLSIVSGSIAMWGAMKAMWLLSTGALAPLTASIWAMTTALLANPYTWIVIAIIAFIGILWYMWDNMDEIIQDFENGWKVFSEAFEKYTKIAGDFMSNLWDDIVIGFWDFVRKWQAIITEYGESISAKFSEIKQKVIDSLMGVFESVTSIFSSAVSKISSIVPDFIKNAFSGGTSKIEVSAKGEPLKTGKSVDGGVGSTTSTWKAWIGFDNLPKGAKVQTTKSKNVNLGMGYGGASG